MEKYEKNDHNSKISCKKMKVKWLGKTHFLGLVHNKIYEVLSVEKDWYRIVDESGEDYLYPPDKFEIIDK